MESLTSFPQKRTKAEYYQFQPKILGSSSSSRLWSSKSFMGTDASSRLKRKNMTQAKAIGPLLEMSDSLDFAHNVCGGPLVTNTDEKELLQGLNYRFARFTEKVRLLEKHNTVLEKEIEELRQKNTSSLSKVYDTEIKELRKLVQDVTLQKRTIEVEHQNLEEDLHFLRDKCEAEANQRSRAEGSVMTLKRNISDAHLSKLELDNKVQSLVEEIIFQNKNHEEEVTEMMVQLQEAHVATDEMKHFAKADITAALRDIRNELEGQASSNVQQTEECFRVRLSKLTKVAEINKEALQSIKQEIQEHRRQLQNKSIELETVKGTKEALESQLHHLEERHDAEMSQYQNTVTQLEYEMKHTKYAMSGQLREYQDLLNVKMALDVEIASYRKLLEGEETRLSSVSSPYISVPCVYRESPAYSLRFPQHQFTFTKAEPQYKFVEEIITETTREVEMTEIEETESEQINGVNEPVGTEKESAEEDGAAQITAGAEEVAADEGDTRTAEDEQEQTTPDAMDTEKKFIEDIREQDTACPEETKDTEDIVCPEELKDTEDSVCPEEPKDTEDSVYPEEETKDTEDSVCPEEPKYTEVVCPEEPKHTEDNVCPEEETKDNENSVCPKEETKDSEDVSQEKETKDTGLGVISPKKEEKIECAKADRNEKTEKDPDAVETVKLPREGSTEQKQEDYTNTVEAENEDNKEMTVGSSPKQTDSKSTSERCVKEESKPEGPLGAKALEKETKSLEGSSQDSLIKKEDDKSSKMQSRAAQGEELEVEQGHDKIAQNLSEVGVKDSEQPQDIFIDIGISPANSVSGPTENKGVKAKQISEAIDPERSQDSSCPETATIQQETLLNTAIIATEKVASPSKHEEHSGTSSALTKEPGDFKPEPKNLPEDESASTGKQKESRSEITVEAENVSAPVPVAEDKTVDKDTSVEKLAKEPEGSGKTEATPTSKGESKSVTIEKADTEKSMYHEEMKKGGETAEQEEEKIETSKEPTSPDASAEAKPEESKDLKGSSPNSREAKDKTKKTTGNSEGDQTDAAKDLLEKESKEQVVVIGDVKDKCSAERSEGRADPVIEENGLYESGVCTVQKPPGPQVEEITVTVTEGPVEPTEKKKAELSASE